jgi:membrane fusion protein (multidrug efflux system)
MARKIGLAVFIVILVTGVLVGVKALQVRKLVEIGKSFAVPPESVSSFVTRQEKWQGTLSAIGSITAVQGVNVTTEVPGLVRDILFEPGGLVSKGDLLVRLDTSSEEAQLRAAQAQWDLARLNLDRERKLREENMVSQSELDAAEATMKQTEANADNIKAIIEKKTIRAPFSGRLGIRLINLGQYLDTGKPIASLQSLTPVYAEFWLPQQDLAKLKTGMQVRLTTDAVPNRQFQGALTVINPDLDPATRSVGLQATFDNADQLLRPGMFARVEVLLPEEKDVLVIPITSVLSAPYGDSVYVIETNSAPETAAGALVVRQQIIRTGAARGDYLSVEAGLKPGERIASSGVFKLRNKMSVVENNEISPKSTEAPKPPDS